MLPNSGIANDSGLDQQVMSRSQDSIQVRRVPLTEGKLASQGVERNSPGYPAVGSGYFEQPVQAPGRRGRQAGVRGARERNRVPRTEIGT